MTKFDEDYVKLLYQLVIQKSGGSFGIRSEALLNSALEAPYATFDGKELFPSKIEKGARLCYGLISNHPFIDGNKRIGTLAMISFFEMNGLNIEFSDEELTELALNIESGKYNYEDTLEFIKEREI